jgi:regulator of cell morphogenesis and NO signaling
MINYTRYINAVHFEQWDFSFLIDYILNNHHFYIKRTLPLIEHNLERCINTDPNRNNTNSEFSKIIYCFTELSNELTTHLTKEEKMLFPYMKKMYIAEKNQLELPPPPFGSISKPVEVMEKEHNNISGLLNKIKNLTNSCNIAESSSETFRMLHQELTDFQEDINIHFHLENHILFPDAIKLEEKLLKHNSII